MFTGISHHGVWVFDQDEALDFYVGKLGLEVVHDIDMDVMRWLTVAVQGRADHQIILMLTEPPAVEPDHAEALRELVARGDAAPMVLATDDCRAEHARLAELGVEITQEPMERFYGIDMSARDPFGNHIRITEPAPQPITPPERWVPADA